LTREGVPSFDHEDIAGIADFIASRVGPPSRQE
jgi:hypothetical protein